MNKKELINRLYELAEWSDANEWDIPIDMGLSLHMAAKIIEGKENAKIIHEYPFVEKDPMFAIGYCNCCGYEIPDCSWHYCPYCGTNFQEIIFATCENCFHKNYCNKEIKLPCEKWQIKL